MSLTDSIANMLTLIRNASKAKHEYVDIPSFNMAKAIAQILKDDGYILNFRISENNKQGILRVYLRYIDKEPVISHIERVSKPGRKIYVRKKEIPFVLKQRGIAIVSTPQGVVTDRKARELGLGGEIICYVW